MHDRLLTADALTPRFYVVPPDDSPMSWAVAKATADVMTRDVFAGTVEYVAVRTEAEAHLSPGELEESRAAFRREMMRRWGL